MKKLVCLFAMVVLAASAYGELQNVEIDGSLKIRLRGNFDHVNSPGGAEVRIPDIFLPARAIGASGALSRYRFDNKGSDREFVEMQTRLGVTADFTDEVRAYIQLESYDRWGEDFRSDYITGADARAATADDVEVFQSYIEANNIFGYPVRARVGRQTLKMGKGFLMGDKSSALIGVSFDAIRLTYAADDLTVDGWWAKVAENFAAEEDGDVDTFGVYATYSGIEWLNLSGYYFLVRDARALADTNAGWFVERFEDLVGLDDYDVTNMHVIGMRAWGEWQNFDYDVEVAYQLGNADAVGFLFPAATFFGVRGDDDAEYDNLGIDAEAGYTFDMVQYEPRVFAGGLYFQGNDDRDATFRDWINPFKQPDASVSFSRMYSGIKYNSFFDPGRVMSNVVEVHIGAEASFTPKLDAGISLAQLWAEETFDVPIHITIGHWQIPIAPGLSFLAEDADDDLGQILTLKGTYSYSDDLSVSLKWEHLFSGPGVDDGNFVDRHGLWYLAGTDDDDADYVECVFAIGF